MTCTCDHDRSTTELVWDASRRGTAVTSEGSRLEVGDEAEWPAEELLTTAVGACFMRTLLRLAADEGIELLGYVSSNHLDVPADSAQSPALRLCVCIVVASPEDGRALVELCRTAASASIVGRALRLPLVVVPQVAVIQQQNVRGAVHAGA